MDSSSSSSLTDPDKNDDEHSSIQMWTAEIVDAISKAPPVENSDFSIDTSSSNSDTTRSYLQTRWKGLLEQLGIQDDHHWFEKLWNMHTSTAENRFYHNAVHLQEMLQHWECLYGKLSPIASHTKTSTRRITLDDSSAIVLATFFHDAIYNVRSSTNEEDSAQLFLQFAREKKLPQPLTQNVQRFILHTQTHQTEDTDTTTLAEQIFLDLDMAVLGKSKAAYSHYASLIRKEYQHVPIDLYCNKRAEILETFLQSTHIYATQFYREAFEDKARQNLRDEIDRLRRKLVI